MCSQTCTHYSNSVPFARSSRCSSDERSKGALRARLRSKLRKASLLGKELGVFSLLAVHGLLVMPAVHHDDARTCART